MMSYNKMEMQDNIHTFFAFSFAKSRILCIILFYRLLKKERKFPFKWRGPVTLGFSRSWGQEERKKVILSLFSDSMRWKTNAVFSQKPSLNIGPFLTSWLMFRSINLYIRKMASQHNHDQISGCGWAGSFSKKMQRWSLCREECTDKCSIKENGFEWRTEKWQVLGWEEPLSTEQRN